MFRMKHYNDYVNGNMKKINDKLFVVNFNYLANGYIWELATVNCKPDELRIKPATFTDDGKLLLNKALPMELYVPWIKAIMTLEDGVLYSKQGFCSAFRILVPDSDSMSDKQIMHLVMSDDRLCGNWTLYENLCKWEQDRRNVERDYKKKHPVETVMYKLWKGREVIWRVFQHQ